MAGRSREYRRKQNGQRLMPRGRCCLQPPPLHWWVEPTFSPPRCGGSDLGLVVMKCPLWSQRCTRDALNIQALPALINAWCMSDRASSGNKLVRHKLKKRTKVYRLVILGECQAGKLCYSGNLKVYKFMFMRCLNAKSTTQHTFACSRIMINQHTAN